MTPPLKPGERTCGDCLHFERCQWLLFIRPDNEPCDFYPSRFREKPTPAPGGNDA